MSGLVKLSKAVKYSGKRIKADKVSLQNFITTDNILQNKGGVTIATGLPPSNSAMPAYENQNILVGNIRPYLKKIWFASQSGGCSADVLVFEVNDGYEPKFIYYSMFRDDFFNHMMKGSKGTKMPRGDKNQILDFSIPDFDLTTQQKIAAVLSSLDSKIELNNRINAELEAMAKTLYDYWFVQFDFPDAKGKPYKTSRGKMVWNEELKREVPEGWTYGTLTSIGEIIGGSTPPRENAEYFSTDGTAWITPKDLSLNTGNKFITKGELDVSDKGIKAASLNIMPKGTILLSSRAPIGYLAISRENVTTNQGFKSFVVKEGFSTEYVYYTIKNLIPTIENNGVGSTFKEVSASTLKTIPVCLPDKTAIKKYTELAQGIFKRQDILEIENQQLSSLRDWLLPMLMNGQVTVKDMEEEKLSMAAEPGVAYLSKKR
jgi:type I restriction enzyme, S subunit